MEPSYASYQRARGRYALQTNIPTNIQLGIIIKLWEEAGVPGDE